MFLSGSASRGVRIAAKGGYSMFSNPSLVTRITIGKGIGLIFGLVGFVFLPFFLPDASWLFRWGSCSGIRP
jgi:hypothetical protein